MTARLSADLVSQAVLARLLHETQTQWQLAAPVRTLAKPRSTLYFFIYTDGHHIEKLVAKMPYKNEERFSLLAWHETGGLGEIEREYHSMQRLATHFAACPTPHLSALQPRFYLPDLNAYVMNHVEGQTLARKHLDIRAILLPNNMERACRAMQRIGEWLAWLHQLASDDFAKSNQKTPADMLPWLLQHVEWLQQFGLPITQTLRWDACLAVLQSVTTDHYVGIHGDYAIRNLIIGRNGEITGIDSALELVDSPYHDLGKFIAMFKYNVQRLNLGGSMPRESAMKKLEFAFLRGYFGDDALGESLDRRLLALYEGRYLFQQWRERLVFVSQNPIVGKVFALMANRAMWCALKTWQARLLDEEIR